MRMIAGTEWSVEQARVYIMDRVHQVPWSGCWLWDQSFSDNGYGQMLRHPEGRRFYVHRLSYEAFVGPIPDGMQVCHKCDVRPCCNPDHFFIGTCADNLRDMRRKDRHNRGERNGHAKLTEGDVREILRRLAAGERQQPIATDFGVSRGAIGLIKRGEKWKHIAR